MNRQLDDRSVTLIPIFPDREVTLELPLARGHTIRGPETAVRRYLDVAREDLRSHAAVPFATVELRTGSGLPPTESPLAP